MARMRSPVVLVGFSVGAIAAAATLAGATASTGEAAGPDWEAAIAAFAIGERRSPMVYTMKDAARCRARWQVHADALEKFIFPEAVEDILISQLQLHPALNAVDFFRDEDSDHPAARDDADTAERLLARALTGDAKAAYSYFENLGLCTTAPETVRDDSADATDAPAAEAPANPSP
ncbi:MAG: hypothetical protein RIA72_04945 [Sphingopyxis sp.]|uniref:hypothetical protein n=1 Tax=Sphingopyxis sp. TaxID=1908224 RepID=UPI0032EBCD3A